MGQKCSSYLYDPESKFPQVDLGNWVTVTHIQYGFEEEVLNVKSLQTDRQTQTDRISSAD